MKMMFRKTIIVLVLILLNLFLIDSLLPNTSRGTTDEKQDCDKDGHCRARLY